MIESFVFQTNLLSINAAVETARAGDAGRGFAVVASEVRNRAQRSAKASKDIAELARNWETEVIKGAARAAEAGTALAEIEDAVVDVANSISEIAGASEHQEGGARSLEGALKRLDQNLQPVASLANENASQSQTRTEDLKSLDDIIEYFSKCKQQRGPPAGVPSDRRTSGKRPS